MTAIPTDTYPAHLIVTEGYTQAPAPAPAQPTQAQAAYDAMDLQSLADTIQAKTGTTFTTGAELLEQTRQEDEEARKEAQELREVQEDIQTNMSICEAILARDWKLAFSLHAEIHSVPMQGHTMRALVHVFGPLRPCCPETVRGYCGLCDGLGVATQSVEDAELARIAREHAAHVA